jgi:hypothetical protein
MILMLEMPQASLYWAVNHDQSQIFDALEIAVVAARKLETDEWANTFCTPFEVEICRRCWWTLYQIQTQRSLDRQLSANRPILESNFPLPLNINDIDLDPHSKDLPKSRQHITDMSYFLSTLEITRLVSEQRNFDGSAIIEALDMPNHCDIDNVRLRVKRIENDCLQYCDVSRPFDWFILLTAKAMLVRKSQT